jgi:copper resistance protein B
MTSRRSNVASLGIALALVTGVAPASAQELDHSSMHMPETAPAPAKEPAATTPVAKPAAAKKPATDPHAGHVMPTPAAAPQPAAVDHAAMGHGAPAQQEPAQSVDHAAMGHDVPTPAQGEAMDHAAMGHATPMAPTAPREPIPVLTDADRAAAFADAGGHEAHGMHDEDIHSFVLFDRLEAWNADQGAGFEWEGQAWIGTDLDRLWLRSEGERIGGRTQAADLEVLYGRSIARWWDLVAGVRHDFKPGASQDFAAIGVMGLAPYKFEVAATAYIGESGQTAARAEIEYETLLTNRLILQPLVELNLYGQDDARRGIGSGLSTVEAGLRLRYEFTRKFAPYVGVVRERAFGHTAELRRDEGEDIDDTRFVAGLRIWF